MKKIIILDGNSVGKTHFIELSKSHNYWEWNINDRNVLSMIAHKTGWNGIRDKKYYEFLEKQEKLVVEYFDFENWYAHDMIKKFQENERVQLLIMHNVKEEIRKTLEQEYENCVSILVVDEDVVDDTYTYTLNHRSENYDQTILNLLSKLGEQEINAN